MTARWPDRGGWNEAIGSHFFALTGEARPVYFCLDDDALIEIARRSGWEPAAEAPDRFLQAIRTYVSQRDAFAEDLRLAQRWWAKDREERSEVPPFLATLGVTVLAASRTGSLSKKGGFYHSTLRRLLGFADPTGEVPGYPAVRQLWDLLARWLRDVEAGRRGLPTAWAPATYWQNIGYSMSQSLLRGSERAGLIDFFLAVGALPGTEMEPEEVKLRLIEWCRTSSKTSERLKGLMDDRDLAPKVAEIAAAQLRRWDGAVRDAQGFRILRLAATLDLRRKRLGAAVRVAADVPVQEVEVFGQRIWLDPKVGWAPLAMSLDREQLLDGVSTWAGDLRIQLRGSPIHVLFPDEQLGAYASAGRMEPGRSILVLAHRTVEDDLAAYLRTHAAEAREITNISLPPGWRAFRDVTVPSTDVELPPTLAPLAPPRGQVPRLVGGLRLSSHRPLYLVGGAPDVDVPGLIEPQVVVVDGEEVCKAGLSGARVATQDLHLRSGLHEVSVGSTRLTFELLPRLAERPREPTLAHHLSRVGNQWAARGPAEPLRPNSDLIISGATISGKLLAEVPHSCSPIMIRARAERYLAVACRCRVAALDVTVPSWFHRAGIEMTAFELDDALVRSGVPFEPSFVVRVMKQSIRIAGVRPTLPHPCHATDGRLKAVLQRQTFFDGGPWVKESWQHVIQASTDA